MITTVGLAVRRTRWLAALATTGLLSTLALVGSAAPATAGSSHAVIAFSDYTNGLFLTQPGSPGSETPIPNTQEAYSPTWSPDGSHLAYSIFFVTSAGLNSEIVEVSRTGAHPHVLLGPLVNDEIGSVAWSPNGKEIAYTCDEAAKGTYGSTALFQLCLLDVATGKTRLVTDPSGVNGLQGTQSGFQRLSWNPAGTEVAGSILHQLTCSGPGTLPGDYCAESDVGVINVKSGAYSILYRNSSESPSFSNDGHHIVFFRADPSGPSGIVVMDPNGHDAHSIVSLKDVDGQAAEVAGDPTYSPDSKEVLFAAEGLKDGNGFAQLYTVKADGNGGFEKFTSHVSDVYDAVWTPALTTCTVPNLKGDSLAKAKKELKKNACTLGKVSGPKKHRKKLVVVKQGHKAKSDLPAGSRVNVTLGKPHKKK